MEVDSEEEISDSENTSEKQMPSKIDGNIDETAQGNKLF